jgi:hypothetical protein
MPNSYRALNPPVRTNRGLASELLEPTAARLSTYLPGAMIQSVKTTLAQSDFRSSVASYGGVNP